MVTRISRQAFIIRYNYVVFLIGLVLMLFGGPASVGLFESGIPRYLDALAVIIFVFGIWTLAESRVLYITGLVFLGGAIVLNAVGVMIGDDGMRYLMLISLTCFLALTMYAATKHIFVAEDVDLNRLFGAACVYLLLGVIFGNIYFFIEVAFPGAFTGVSDGSFSQRLVEMTYHSFVTLTTLGYGDINPVQPLARTVCYLEAVLGQIYLTILVAALVGMHIATRQSKRRK